MVYKINDSLLDQFINDFAEGRLSKGELEAFSEIQNTNPAIRAQAQAGIRVRKYLKNLRKVNSRPGFDQRMAAKFAMELEKEVNMNNKKRISQPAVSP